MQWLRSSGDSPRARASEIWNDRALPVGHRDSRVCVVGAAWSCLVTGDVRVTIQRTVDGVTAGTTVGFFGADGIVTATPPVPPQLPRACAPPPDLPACQSIRAAIRRALMAPQRLPLCARSLRHTLYGRVQWSAPVLSRRSRVEWRDWPAAFPTSVALRAKAAVALPRERFCTSCATAARAVSIGWPTAVGIAWRARSLSITPIRNMTRLLRRVFSAKRRLISSSRRLAISLEPRA